IIRSNLVDPENWGLSSLGSWGVLATSDGYAYAVDAAGPSGGQERVLIGVTPTSGEGGGGVSRTFPVPQAGVMCGCWFYTPAWPQVYFGFSGSGETENLDGSPNANPYFAVGNPPTTGRWFLAIGILQGENSTEADSGLSGIWDPQTGTRVVAGGDFRQ